MKQVGGYRILEELGRGATGIVYKGVDPKANRTVAVKAIRPEPARKIDASSLEALRRVKALSHPSIAALYDVVQEKDQVYAVYEYVPGLSLEVLLRRLALPEKPLLLRCFAQIADALDYADAKGIVHRDVRPSNIIVDIGRVTDGAIAKITDFGVSQIAPHEMTQDGAMVGTPLYLSPEEIQGTTVDGRSDQFSFAVVLYEILSGTKPFIADNLAGIFFQICRQPPKPVDEINPSLTREVNHVLERALAKNPAQRFPSCTDFIQALEHALHAIPEWASTATRTAAAGVPALGTAGIFAPQFTPQPEEVRRLPSLPPRARDQDKQQPAATKTHSTGKLLALMLALSAVAIAISVIWGQWNWHSILPVPKQAVQKGLPESTKPAQQPEQERPSPQPPTTATVPPPSPETNPAATPKAPEPKQQPAETKKPVAAKREPTGPVPGATASIDLLSVPPGATIVIDGNKNTSCVTPCTMSLPNGRHTAAVDLNGYNTARRVFNVPDDNSIVAALTKSTGTLVVTSTPPGSQIVVDNKPYGVTPATLHLSAGSHKLVLIHGSMQHEETIEVEGGELQSRSLRWQ